MYSCGLVLEGGGNRAIYTSGVLDAFMDQGITFPYVIGVSAGSCNAVSYIGKCRGRQHDISIQYSGDKRFMSLENMIKNGEFLNGEWLFGELSYDLSPLDQEAYDRANTTLCVVVTNALTGKAEYMYPKDFHKRGCPILRASCALPGATKGVVLGKDRYFDGGVTDSIPLAHAYEDGCQKAVVVLTQDRNYQKQPMGHARLIRRIFRKYPLMTRAILNRYKIYNRQLEAVWDAQGRGDAFVIAPDHPLHLRAQHRQAGANLSNRLPQCHGTNGRAEGVFSQAVTLYGNQIKMPDRPFCGLSGNQIPCMPSGTQGIFVCYFAFTAAAWAKPSLASPCGVISTVSPFCSSSTCIQSVTRI